MKVTLALSDPWIMGEELGWPSIPATVIHQDGDEWLVEVDQPFEYGGEKYQYLVISHRHVGTYLNQYTSMSVSCNMTRTTKERVSSASPCDTSWWRGGHAMTGSLMAAQQADATDGPSGRL